MKKNIAKRLNDLASTLPHIYEWEDGVYKFTGYELNLTPLGDQRKFDDLKVYDVILPQMKAVMHKQQIKDAFNTGGLESVTKYVDKVTNRYREILVK